MSIELSSQEELEDWLDENYWFQDGYCLGLIVSRETKKVVLTLAYQIKGTYEANSERVRRVFEIAAEDIVKVPELDSNDFNSEHCMEGIDVPDRSDGITFSLDVPKILNIACKRITVTEKENLIDIVEPWFSDNELFVQVKDHNSIPKAETWVHWFKEDGVNISWRYYSGEARNSSSISNGNYEGWYLQELSVIPKTTAGLFFQHLKTEGSNLGFHVTRSEFDDRYWVLFEKYLLRIDSLKINCGNCTLSHEEWESYLSDVQNQC